MNKNIGNLDRKVRIILAVVFVACYFMNIINGYIGLILLYSGGVLLATALLNFCPIYKILGIESTLQQENEEYTPEEIVAVEKEIVINSTVQQMTSNDNPIFTNTKSENMTFQVVPFNAKISSNDTSSTVARQMQTIIDSEVDKGWEYLRMETVKTRVAGEKGCFGLGAEQGSSTTNYNVLIFRK